MQSKSKECTFYNIVGRLVSMRDTILIMTFSNPVLHREKHMFP
jgi:hypothetical protein